MGRVWPTNVRTACWETPSHRPIRPSIEPDSQYLPSGEQAQLESGLALTASDEAALARGGVPQAQVPVPAGRQHVAAVRRVGAAVDLALVALGRQVVQQSQRNHVDTPPRTRGPPPRNIYPRNVPRTPLLQHSSRFGVLSNLARNSAIALDAGCPDPNNSLLPRRAGLSPAALFRRVSVSPSSTWTTREGLMLTHALIVAEDATADAMMRRHLRPLGCRVHRQDAGPRRSSWATAAPAGPDRLGRPRRGPAVRDLRLHPATWNIPLVHLVGPDGPRRGPPRRGRRPPRPPRRRGRFRRRGPAGRRRPRRGGSRRASSPNCA